MSDLRTVDSRPGMSSEAGMRAPQDHARSLQRRKGLPSGRAVVGGLLVIVAAVGVFAAYTEATALPDTAWWVARRPIPIGQRIDPGADLKPVAIALPEQVGKRVFSSSAAPASSLAGAVAIAPIAADDLIERSDIVLARGGLIANEEIAVSVTVDRAVAGTLKPGERVDILATYGSDTSACTTAVVRGALLLRIPDLEDGREGAATSYVLGLDRPEQSAAVADAMNSAKIVIVRTTAGSGPVRVSGDCFFRPSPLGADPLTAEADS
ncbi:MAG: hypothetical protein ACRD0K_14415 [Egibacteraceae bacterium]